jgi:hypothetical protein
LVLNANTGAEIDRVFATFQQRGAGALIIPGDVMDVVLPPVNDEATVTVSSGQKPRKRRRSRSPSFWLGTITASSCITIDWIMAGLDSPVH